MSEMNSPQKAQTWALCLGLIMVVLAAASVPIINAVMDAQAGIASGGKTEPYLTVTTDEIASADLVFINATGKERTIDVYDQLVDVPNPNDGGFDGIGADITLGQTLNGQANNTEPGSKSYLVLTLKNGTVGAFDKAHVSRMAYTFEALASGEYLKNHLDTANATEWHTATDKHFQLGVGFVEGSGVLTESKKMDVQTGSKEGDNFTQEADITWARLAPGLVAGHEKRADYDNPVTIKIDGYRAGSDGQLSDDVVFSVQFQRPAGAGVWSYTDGWGYSAAGYTLLLFAMAWVASPAGKLEHLAFWSRRARGEA